MRLNLCPQSVLKLEQACGMGQPNILLPLLLAFCLIVFKEHLGKEKKVHLRKRELASALCVHLVRMPVR